MQVEVHDVDPEVAKALRAEAQRQHRNLELIASENFVSEAVLEAVATALPQLLHGGPGRAGGGEELGGLRGLSFYMQRVALEGSRPLIERIAGIKPGGFSQQYNRRLVPGP